MSTELNRIEPGTLRNSVANESTTLAADQLRPTEPAKEAGVQLDTPPQPQDQGQAQKDDKQRLDPAVAPINQTAEPSRDNTPKFQAPQPVKPPETSRTPTTTDLSGGLKLTTLEVEPPPEPKPEEQKKNDQVKGGVWLDLPGGAKIGAYLSETQGLVLGLWSNPVGAPAACDFAIAFNAGSVVIQTTSHGETLATDLHNVIKRFAVVTPIDTPPVPIQ